MATLTEYQRHLEKFGVECLLHHVRSRPVGEYQVHWAERRDGRFITGQAVRLPAASRHRPANAQRAPRVSRTRSRARSLTLATARARHSRVRCFPFA
jgi:hypothetical protein